MNQRKLSRHNSRQSSIGCETASVASIKSFRSDHSTASSLNNGLTLTSKSSKSSQNGFISRQGSQESGSYKSTNKLGSSNSAINGTTASKNNATGQTTTNILNVAEMLLHGVADNEILDIWLHSIQCDQFVSKFIDAGYDMPTLSRITPQDLTAIGVTDPTLRTKILTEIKKLNLQDGIPNFKPASLSHWLDLIKLDKHYYKLLCDQDVDTIDKLCQLTWEDFEDLGITKLGHQKRIQLAIDRIKELNASDTNGSKSLSEPIYDINPSQILLVSSAENHAINGPINKQSSTSELSSTGSGSMHSVYSAASTQYLQNGATSSQDQNMNSNSQTPPDFNHHNNTYSQQLPSHIQKFPHPPTMIDTQQQRQQNQQQLIYSQPIYQQTTHMGQYNTLVPQRQMQQQHNQYMSHYQPVDHPLPNGRPMQNNIYGDFATTNGDINGFGHGQNVSQPIQNRQSMCQLSALSRLANLPKHQQQQLQQSSIYATLTRQPMMKMKRTPPPVPPRTNSLKSNSLTDEMVVNNQQTNVHSMQHQSIPKIPHQQDHRPHMMSNNGHPGFNNIHNSTMGANTDRQSNGPQFDSQKVAEMNTATCNATMGKDEDFPPPPSPLPCITESYGITT